MQGFSIVNAVVPLLLLVIIIHDSTAQSIEGHHKFSLDLPRNRFVKDGQTFRFIAGSIHYFRIPNFYWSDRLMKMRAAGLNAISTYVPWNLHEPFEGQYDFSGDANITNFLQIAHDLGFVVILRAGPYICGEWEFGGLPWWLLKHKDMKPRTSDPRYLNAIFRYYKNFFPRILPYLYRNGGPIVMVQVENEYGSNEACDSTYKAYLRDLFRQYLGQDTVLITTDGGHVSFLKCGYTPGVYPTIDFGSWVDRQYVANAFVSQRAYAPQGPLVNMELYPGWLHLWGKNYTMVPSHVVTNAMRYIWELGANMNFYVFMGGTNFAYWNSADPETSVTTSYDYNAPLSEAGDPTEKLFAIRTEIQSLTGWQLPAVVPPALPKASYGTVAVDFVGTLFDHIHILSPTHTHVKSEYPLSMEDVNHPYGFILYETVIPFAGTELYANGVKDQAYVHINGRLQGKLIQRFGSVQKLNMELQNIIPGQKLQLLIENTGRLTRGYYDSKGLVSNVTLDGVLLKNWNIYPIQLANAFQHQLKPKQRLFSGDPSDGFVPSLYTGHFVAQEIADTFFDPTGWSKGQYLINNQNAGRYWPIVGPQVTLYTPRTMLNYGNDVILFELQDPGNCVDSTKTKCHVTFTETPYINKPVSSDF